MVRMGACQASDPGSNCLFSFRKRENVSYQKRKGREVPVGASFLQ